MKHLHAVAAMTALFAGFYAAATWSMGLLTHAGTSAAISAAAVLLWEFCDRLATASDDIEQILEDFRGVWPNEAGAPE